MDIIPVPSINGAVSIQLTSRRDTRTRRSQAVQKLINDAGDDLGARSPSLDSMDDDGATRTMQTMATRETMDTRENHWPRHATRNWIGTIVLNSISMVAAVGYLAWFSSVPEGGGIATPFSLAFNGVFAIVASISPILSNCVEGRQEVEKGVTGQPEIPVTKAYGVPPLTWFTHWSNLFNCTHFWLAAIADAMYLSQGAVSPILTSLVIRTWEIIFPVSFLVNVLVSYAIIPQYVASGIPYNVFSISTWRAELSHNGFVLVAACKAAVFQPQMALEDFPVVIFYCACYIFMSWWLYYTRGIFHYFFLDPRFKHALIADLVLKVLLTVFYLGGLGLLRLAQESIFGSFLIVLFALGVCTWRAPRNVVDCDDERMTVLQGWALFWRASACCAVRKPRASQSLTELPRGSYQDRKSAIQSLPQLPEEAS